VVAAALDASFEQAEMKELRPKVKSGVFRLASIDRNLESSLQEQGLLERLSSEVSAVNLGDMKEADVGCDGAAVLNPDVTRIHQPMEKALRDALEVQRQGGASLPEVATAKAATTRAAAGTVEPARKVKSSKLFDLDGNDNDRDDVDDIGVARRPWRHTITKHPPSRWEFENDQDFNSAKLAFESTIQFPPLKHNGLPVKTASASAMPKLKSSASNAQPPPRS
jgi:hypothetical protein